MKENYWLGFVVGILLSLVLSSVLFLGVKETMAGVSKKNSELELRLELAEMSVAEHERIMRTYEFFNKTWERLYNKENQEDFEK